MIRNIDAIRVLSAEAVEKACSGHPGLPLGAANMAYTLWDKVMKHNPKNPEWFNRDRFVLSAGHGSALIYTLLHLFGYGLPMEELKKFRQLDSKTPGHPEYGHTIGVETTTGPLGQGFANAVGMALAERYLAAYFNRPDYNLIDHYTYAIVGDGCLMEGIAYEAASFAGTQQLGKLIVLYDSNKITIEGSTDLAFTEDVHKRFEAMGWDVLVVEDGNDASAIEEALLASQKTVQPSLIIAKTIIGFGAPGKEGTHGVHGSPLGAETLTAMKKLIDWPEEAFHVPEEVRAYFEAAQPRYALPDEQWQDLLINYSEAYPSEFKDLKRWINNNFSLLPLDEMKADEKTTATRNASGIAINKLAALNKNFIGGSADLAPSNKSNINGEEGQFPETPMGRNIHFGVREHSMAAISNGIALHGGLKPFAATFLVFSDYMKPSIRLAALMQIDTTFVFTHDSIGVGEDGPTHQPIEHLLMLRSIPGMKVYRPADYFETMLAWESAMVSKGPAAIIATRQNLEPINSSKEGLKGAYIVRHEEKQLDGIIVASGSEVKLAIDTAEALADEGLDIRVVSMLSMEVYDTQSEDYKAKILPKVKTLAVEAASPLSWYKYTPHVIGMTTFGASAPADELFKRFGFTVEHLVETFKKI